MGGAFFSGLSGLTASSLGIETVGNNLSNTNTTGFKKNNVFFQELLFLGGATAQTGQGTVPLSVQQVFAQGNIQQSQVPTDMAIQGNGFFIVGDANSQFFTRAGNFQIDRQGRLVTTEGLFVLGFPAENGRINENAELQQIVIGPGQQSQPVQTTLFRLSTNLNSQTAVNDSFSTSLIVFDSLGASHVVTTKFTRIGNPEDRQWDFEATISQNDLISVGNPNAAGDEIIAKGEMIFDVDGKLARDGSGLTIDASTPGVTFDVITGNLTGLSVANLNNGAADIDLDWVLFDDLDNSQLNQFNIPSATSEAFQDGTSSGTLTSLIIRRDGTIEGLLSNGQTTNLARVALSSFTNPQGLVRVGNNLFARTELSGEPAIGKAGSGGRGEIAGSALESSNVDISEEFIRMIIFQRAFQANSRLVTTADQVIQEAIGLVR